MDEQVLAAMRKWPDVPAVYGWLRLGRRGEWLLVDRGRPDFDEARDGGGSPITSPPILEFIARNYGCDAQGAWFWQNGPQRVWVDITLAPLLLRVLNTVPAQRLVTHTGIAVSRIDRVCTDTDGNLLALTDLGPAAFDDRDIGQLVLEQDERPAAAASIPAESAVTESAAGKSMAAESWLLCLDAWPGPVALADGRRVWPIESLPVSGATAVGQALGFVAQPRQTPSSPAPSPPPAAGAG